MEKKETDMYRTISKQSEKVLFKDKNSKFFGFAFPVKSESDVKNHLENLKKEHHSARHWCYAYQIGTETINYRTYDDGEPNNSAGQPIYGQILSFGLTNILIVVVRYYGGVKLGVGGLINAYKTTAQMALETSKIIERTINEEFVLSFDYKNLNSVMRAIKDKDLKIVSQRLELSCEIQISVRKSDANAVFDKLNAIYEIKIDRLND